MRMLDMLERATWPMRRLFWWFEEHVLWLLSDAVRGRGAHAAPAVADAAPRLRRFDLRIALATVGGAAVIGIAVAALVVSSGGKDSATAPASGARIAANPAPAAASPAESEDPGKLQGVTPKFKAASQAAAAQTPSATKAQAKAQASPTSETNSKPSSIPAAAANQGEALRTARDFAGAFVLYEVGKTDATVKRTFARTATPGLARALKDRPPRLPGSAKVPVAKVQNVVLGQRTGRLMEASVSLLRFGTLSELRLSLFLRDKRWAVGEVRG